LAKNYQTSLFEEADLKEPLHDKIMLWLDANAELFLNELVEKYTKMPISGLKATKKIWEHKIKSGYQNAFIDLVFEYEYIHSDGQLRKNRLYIEVKSKIPSLGELIRQIHQYQDILNSHECKFCVVATEDKYEAILFEQGILYYKYNG